MPRERNENGDIVAAGHRHGRLQQIIFEELDALVRDEVTDPALAGVRVLAVELSIDFKNARVRCEAPADANPQKVERALERATPFLRTRLGDALDIKRTPLLRFVLTR